MKTMIFALVAAVSLVAMQADAQTWSVRPGAYGYGPFHWGSGRYWGSWGGYAPGPRYYNRDAYRWSGWRRWRYQGY